MGKENDAMLEFNAPFGDKIIDILEKYIQVFKQ